MIKSIYFKFSTSGSTKGFVGLNLMRFKKKLRLSFELTQNDKGTVRILNCFSNVWIRETLLLHQKLCPLKICTPRIFFKPFFTNNMINGILICESNMLLRQTGCSVQHNRQNG